MNRSHRILFLWEVIGGLLLFASFWISRWGRCSLYGSDDEFWPFTILFISPIIIAIIFFGRIRTFFFLVLHALFGFAIPEDIAESWDILVIVLVGIIGFLFVAFSSCT